MSHIINMIKRYTTEILQHVFYRPNIAMALIAFTSFFSLALGLFSEAFLGLEPCILCIYQRWPFLIGVVIGGAYLLFLRKSEKLIYHVSAFAVLSMNFLINSIIALYHSGVERGWWASKLEGCKIPDFSGPPQSILENIMSAPAGKCTEIAWMDPIFGLSMANYNVALSLGISAFCLWHIAKLKFRA